MADKRLRELVRTYKAHPTFQNYLALATTAFRYGSSAAEVLGPAAEATLFDTLREYLHKLFIKDSCIPFANRRFSFSLERLSSHYEPNSPWSDEVYPNELWGVDIILTENIPVPHLHNNFAIQCRIEFPYSEVYMADILSERLDLLADPDNWDRCISCKGKRTCVSSATCGRGVVTPKRKKLKQTPFIQVSCRRDLPEEEIDVMGDDPHYTTPFTTGMTEDVQNFTQDICRLLEKHYSEVRCPSPRDYCFIYSSPSPGYY